MTQYNSLVLSDQVQVPMQSPTGTNSQWLPLKGPRANGWSPRCFSGLSRYWRGTHCLSMLILDAWPVPTLMRWHTVSLSTYCVSVLYQVLVSLMETVHLPGEGWGQLNHEQSLLKARLDSQRPEEGQELQAKEQLIQRSEDNKTMTAQRNSTLDHEMFDMKGPDNYSLQQLPGIFSIASWGKKKLNVPWSKRR